MLDIQHFTSEYWRTWSSSVDWKVFAAGKSRLERHCHVEQVEAVFDRGEAKALESRSRALFGKTVEASKTR